MSGARDDVLRHTQILASAGSGKTFQLTSRYLGLITHGAPVGSILATTFTRAAAGEIRDRVLMRLARAAEDDDERRKLAEAVGLARLERAQILGLLRDLTSNMHRMQIRTLDSFFGAVVRAFAVELGVPVDARIVEGAEATALRHEAIRAMLAGEATGPFVELLRLLTQGESSRSVMRVIDGAIGSLHDLYRESAAAAWDREPMRPELPAGEVAAAIDDVAACPMPAQARWRSAHDASLASARAEDWDRFLGAGLAAKVALGENTFYRRTIDDPVVRAYRPLVDHAGAVLVNRMREQTRATFKLLDRFDARYAQVRARRGAMTFSDVTAAVLSAQELGSFAEICYRIDAGLRHLLLDEFQDTSIRQWRAIEPIAREIVADETQPRTFFCVGDAKQSIYVWRDAAPQVLDAVPDLLVGPDGTSAIRQERLAVSYRAAPVMIEAINRIFGSLAGNVAVEEYGEAARQFAKDFEPHETTKRDQPGCAELRTAPRAGPGAVQAETRLRAAAELVRELHDRAPDKSIAVLTRTNGAVARILFELSPARLDLPASGRGGGPLTDSPAVNAMLDLLRLADHPDDTVAAFNVAHGPLGPEVGLDDPLDAATRTRVSRSVRRRLLDDGYGRALAAWTARLAPACDERQHRRLEQLVERAGTWEPRSTLRPSDLVRIVEEEIVPEARPAPVQVMTIHQSKGLEYDVVVLPDLEGPLKGRGQEAVVVDRRGATGPIERVFRWVSKELRPFMPEVAAMIEEHDVRVVRESLSLLYVAVTRAKQGLYMVIDPASVSARGKLSSTIRKTPAGLLYAALAEGREREGDRALFTLGEPERVFAAAAAPRPAPAPAAPALAIRLAPPTGALSRVRAAAPASSAGGARQTLAKRLRLGDEEALERGRAVHRLFEQVTWYEDWSADEARLVGLVRRVAPRRSEAWARAVVGYFLGSLEKSQVRAVMSRGAAPADSVMIWRERRYVQLVAGGRGPARADGPDALVQQGSIDRLEVTLDASGRPCSARLIDFKTDRVSEREAAASVEQYRAQLDTYRSAAARMLRIDASKVTTLLLFVDPPVAVELGGAGAAPSLVVSRATND